MVSERWQLAVLALVGLAGLAALFAFDPAGSSVFPPCPFHAVTGLHCPGCGTARALHQLLHGNLLGALSLNPLMVSALPFIAYAGLSAAVRAVRGRGLPRVFLPAAWIWVIFGVIVLFWILRNIPVYPFSLLAP